MVINYSILKVSTDGKLSLLNRSGGGKTYVWYEGTDKPVGFIGREVTTEEFDAFNHSCAHYGYKEADDISEGWGGD